MSLISVVVTLIVVGVLLWLVNNYDARWIVQVQQERAEAILTHRAHPVA